MMMSVMRSTATLAFQQRATGPIWWSCRNCSSASIRHFSSKGNEDNSSSSIRLSKLLAQGATNLAMSRRQAERFIQEGSVTLAGQVVRSPQMLLDWKDLNSGSVVLKLNGKAVVLENPKDKKGNNVNRPKVWAVHKLSGEVVTENDPQNRPSMLQRLVRGGVGRIGKKQHHLKPIGRLDMPTEGLILVTNDGEYARQMELPTNLIHRVYRARVHGRLTSYKLDRIRQGGLRYEDIRYGPMKVAVETPRRGTKTSTNTWLRISSTEGKNRQIRNVFAALGVTVTRLIRVAYGDYDLQTIPPGMAIEVPYKRIENQKEKGLLAPKRKRSKPKDDMAQRVKWVRSVQ